MNDTVFMMWLGRVLAIVVLSAVIGLCLAAVVWVAKRDFECLNTGAIDRRQIGVQKRLVIGRSVEGGRQSCLLCLQLHYRQHLIERSPVP